MSRLKVFDSVLDDWIYVGGGDSSPYIGPEPPLLVTDGKLWWDTDDNSILPSTIDPNVLAVDTAFTSRYSPISRGKIAYAQVVATQGSIVATIVDVTGLSVTWTAISSRYYRISVQCEMYSTVATDVPIVFITDASNVQKNRISIPFTQATVSNTLYGESIETGLSGSITRKVRAQRAIGTGNLTVNSATDRPAFILVEDIGT